MALCFSFMAVRRKKKEEKGYWHQSPGARWVWKQASLSGFLIILRQIDSRLYLGVWEATPVSLDDWEVDRPGEVQCQSSFVPEPGGSDLNLSDPGTIHQQTVKIKNHNLGTLHGDLLITQKTLSPLPLLLAAGSPSSYNTISKVAKMLVLLRKYWKSGSPHYSWLIVYPLKLHPYAKWRTVDWCTQPCFSLEL